MKVFSPKTLTEALDIREKEAAMPFSGGTDLMVRYRAKNGLGPKMPASVMFVNALPELRGVRLTDDGTVEIGAAVPMAVLADDPGARAAYAESGAACADALAAVPSLLSAAAFSLGAPALRNRATLGGNTANASPAGDGLCALYALDARVILTSVRGKREVLIGEFVSGPGRTALAADEIITAFRVPAAGNEMDEKDSSWHYWRKVGTRRANALTKVSLAAFARMADGRVGSFAMAFGAVGPTVVRPLEAEAVFLGHSAGEILRDTDGMIRRASGVIKPLIKPIDDQRSTAKYRKTVALNLAGEAFGRFAAYLKGNEEC